MHIFGIISAVLFAICFIPQIAAIVKTKETAGISLWLLIIIVIAHVMGILYVISIKSTILICSYSVGLVLSSTILTLVIYCRKQNK